MIQPKRILLKISGEALSSGTDMFDYGKINTLAKKIVDLSNRGIEVAVVCGAGNIRRHRDTLEAGIDRVKSDHLGMLATVMNAVQLNEKIIKNGGDGMVYSPNGIQIPPLTKIYNSLGARRRLKDKRVVFCAGGSGNPFSTTDLGATLRALELNCDMVIKATKVDGVYDKDPMKYPDAKRFDHLTLAKANELRIDIMDHSAIAMAMDNALPIFVCHIDELEKIGTPDIKGTLVETDK